MQLSDFINATLGIVAPILNPSAPETLEEVKLLSVEAGGIWIESQSFTNRVLRKIGVATSPKTLAIFLPYQAIAIALSSTEGVSLDEKAFDV